MRIEHLIWAGLIIAALTTGWLIGRTFSAEKDDTTHKTASFRAWFWEYRSLDLLAQVGLIFAGALGVGALLPGQREMREISARNEEPDAPLV
ncbi:MAG: hypothetical protein ACP5JJ_11700 [Anaerolineae bacterium]